MASPEAAIVMSQSESTFSILRGLQQDVHKLQLALAEEQAGRVKDVLDLRAQLEDLRQIRNMRLDDIIEHIAEISSAKLARFDKLAAYVENVRQTKSMRFERLESVVSAEMEDRKHACISHANKAQQVASEWKKVREAAIVADSMQAEIASQPPEERQADIRNEVDRRTESFSKSGMVVDPYKRSIQFPLPPESPESHLATATSKGPKPWRDANSMAFGTDGFAEINGLTNLRLPRVANISADNTQPRKNIMS